MKRRFWNLVGAACAGLLVTFSGMNMNVAHGDEPMKTTKAAPTAAELMRRAHFGRAMWSDFPGFRADVVLTVDGETQKGTFQLDAKGEAKLVLEGNAKAEWAERTLRSVVGHRFATDHYESDVEFADDEVNHPLGRLIKSTNPDEKSLWRVKGDVLTEVHRFGPESHFVITVGSVHRNAEGAHLPQNFTVVTWKNGTGELITSRQVYNEWTRVGEYDLPVRLVAINNKPGGERRVEQIQLSGLQLLPVAAASN